ncbi:hypothetical protein F2Q70_00013684 [Brassica cretica]|uniref:AAA+ ATPase At3g28540-like C-terminal domain-containing protein n=1 Tax=Brassica cretica TaxID=69181 RepID=A0A8S9M518_BRACR|nr:hypothetical protein F2Q70_00013684 [Brassica cretica]
MIARRLFLMYLLFPCSNPIKVRVRVTNLGLEKCLGLLDFMDRGCSNSGDQRTIVFTATNKEKPGSAFLRARGIDVHIHMPDCPPDAFEILASNYLYITTHELFSEIKESIMQTEVTPAEVAEQLLDCGSDNKILERLVEFSADKRGKAQET